MGTVIGVIAFVAIMIWFGVEHTREHKDDRAVQNSIWFVVGAILVIGILVMLGILRQK